MIHINYTEDCVDDKNTIFNIRCRESLLPTPTLTSVQDQNHISLEKNRQKELAQFEVFREIR